MREIKLESKTFASAGNVQIPTKAIPTGMRLAGFMLRLAIAATCGAAAVEIPGSHLFRLFATIDIVRPGAFAAQRYSGAFLFYLNWMMQGRSPQIPASIPAGALDAVYNREVVLWVPFEDPSSQSVTDCAQPSESFGGNTNLSIDFAAVSGLGAAFASLKSLTGTLRTVAVCFPNDATIGADLKQGYFDHAGQTPVAEGGRDYEYLFAYKEDMSAITSDEVATLQVSADGQSIIDAIQTQEIVGLFDHYRSSGSEKLTDSATAPDGGEQVNDEPGVGAGAGAGISFPFLPILSPRTGYKASEIVSVDQSLTLQTTGTLTMFRFGYRTRQHRNETQRKAAGATVIGTVPTVTEIKTTSKLPLSPFKDPRLSRVLPFRAK